MKVAIITASTAVYKGEQEDASGKVIRKMVEEAGLDVVFMKALPTDKTVLSTVFQRMADGNLADLILTTGGAGCGPEDCTPEATMEVVDRPLLGIPEGMRAHMLTLTKRAMLNRAAAGIWLSQRIFTARKEVSVNHNANRYCAGAGGTESQTNLVTTCGISISLLIINAADMNLNE